MSGTALSVSWLALLLAIIGYVLKRWWDNADSIMEHRRVAYSDYFSAAYDMGRELMHRPDDPEAGALADAYERFQKSNPEFLLHASPRAMITSDEYVRRFFALKSADRSSWSDAEKLALISQLSEALGVLREQFKSELFLTQPRFQIERLRHRADWKRLQREAIEVGDKGTSG